MAEKKSQELEQFEVLHKAKGFWDKYSKIITIVGSVIIVVAGGWLVYKNFFLVPKEEKAQEEIFKAEQNFRKDSVSLALNGMGTTPGFLKVIKKYSGTKTANLAKLYAGECYLQLGDYNNAIKYLKEFNANGAKQVEAKVYGLLGDAYSEQKKNNEAIDNYRKAGTTFESDEAMSSEYLFRAALLLEISGKTKEAAELYQTIKDKYPRTERGFAVDKYLSRLGVSKS